MVGENILSDRERLHDRERFIPRPGGIKAQNKTRSNTIIEKADDGPHIADDSIPLFETSNYYVFEKTNGIPRLYSESSNFEKDTKTQRYIDESNIGLGREPSDAVDSEILERLSEVLDKPYNYANLGIHALESESKKLNSSYWSQLIDAMGHIREVLVGYPGDKKSQLDHLDEAENILKRISIESFETYVTELFSPLEKCSKKPRIYYRLIFFPMPDKNKIDTYLAEVRQHLERGRQLKRRRNKWELCLEEFEKAYEGIEILKNLLPDDNEAKYRIFMVLIPIMALFVSIAVTIVLYFM